MPIQQFNQGINAIDRQKFKGLDLSPQQTDFKDSTNPYQDADVVMGIMNPWKMDFKEYDGHELTTLKSNYRYLKVIKNRKGRDNQGISLFFKPEGGHFEELPQAIEFTTGLNGASYTNYI